MVSATFKTQREQTDQKVRKSNKCDLSIKAPDMNRVLSLFSTAFGLHDCPSVVTIDSKTVTSIWLWSVLNIREGKDNMLK